MSRRDPDFGSMKDNDIDAWNCRVEFDLPHPLSRQFAVHVWASVDGPTPRQRSLFRELKSNYNALWPAIAEGILNQHATLNSIDDLNRSVPEFVSVHIGENGEDSIELVYNLDLSTEGSRGYFVRLDDWKVADVFVAD